EIAESHDCAVGRPATGLVAVGAGAFADDEGAVGGHGICRAEMRVATGQEAQALHAAGAGPAKGLIAAGVSAETDDGGAVAADGLSETCRRHSERGAMKAQ